MILSSAIDMSSDGTTGTVLVERTYPTDVADLWEATTDPERLARWLVVIDGDARLGGTVQLRFLASGFEGSGEIVECVPPRQLCVITRGEDGSTSQLSATVGTVPGGAQLRVQESEIRAADVRGYAGGWTLHLEDLATYLEGGERQAWTERWPRLERIVADLPVREVTPE